MENEKFRIYVSKEEKVDKIIDLSVDEIKTIIEVVKKDKPELYKDFLPDTKHYLGDVKWVLYQYICDLGEITNYISIRCGNYAYSKISKIGEPDGNNTLSRILNGEFINIVNCKKLPKDQIIISTEDIFKGVTSFTLGDNITIYPNDIVLYFA